MTPEEKKLLLTKQYQKELKLTQKLAREESKLASQGSKSTEQRLKAQQKITKLKEKEHSLQLKIRNIDKEVEQIYKKEKTYIDDIAKKLEEINVSDSKKAKSAKAIHGISSMVAELEQKKVAASAKGADIMGQISDLGKDLNDAQLKNLKNSKQIGKEGFEQVDIKEQLEKIAKLENVLANKKLKLGKGERVLLKNRLEGMKKAAKQEQAKAQVQSKVNDLHSKAKKSMIGQIFQGGILIGLLKIIWKLVTAYNARLDEIGKTYGAIGLQNEELRDSLMDAGTRATGLGYSFEETASVINKLNTEFGITLDIATELSNKVMDTSKALALSLDEGSDLFGTLMQVFKMSEDTTDQFLKQSALLALQNKVAPQKVMKDIAKSTEYIAKYGTKNLALVTRTAVQAAKWGGTLKDIENIADGLLNYEQSLNAEMQASIMFGKQFNMTRARNLAMDGEHEKMMIEIKAQLGDQADMLEKSVLHRRVMAQLLNVDIQTMNKYLGQQKEALTIQGIIAQQPSWEEILGKNSVGMITDLTLKFKELVAIAVEELGPVFYDFFDSFGQWLDSGSAIEDIRGFIKGLGESIQGVASHAKTLIGIMFLLRSASLAAGAAQMILAMTSNEATKPAFGASAAITFSVIAGLIAAISGLGLIFGGGGASMPTTNLASTGTVKRRQGMNKQVDDFVSLPQSNRMLVTNAGMFPINNFDTVQGSTQKTTDTSTPDNISPTLRENVNVGKDTNKALSEAFGFNGLITRKFDEMITEFKNAKDG